MISFRVQRGWSYDGYQAWVIEYKNGKTYIAEPIELKFVEHPEAIRFPEPTLRIGGVFADEFLKEAKKALAGFTPFDDKEEYENAKRVEKAMQAHIDSLKLVIDRTLI